MKQLINQVYLKKETLQQLSEHFSQNPEFPSVTLAQFFSKEGMEQILQEVIDAEFTKDYNEIMHRRQITELTDTLMTLLQSDTFNSIFKEVTGNTLVISNDLHIQKYGHRDYKIIHDDTVLDTGYDIIIDLTPEWDDNLGGYVAYTDGEGQFYTIGSSFGAISIVKRDESLHYFVKYVNHYAENLNRYLVIVNTPVER